MNKMAKNTNHIEGIYNYCDRWCERCNFTSRCAVYENEDGLTPEEKDINNKAFWDKIGNSFADAMMQIKKMAEERGITLPAADDEEMNEYMTNTEKKLQEMEQHSLIKYCKEYMIQARVLLKNNEALKQNGETLLQLVELGVKDISETKKEVIQLNEYFEIVQWYLFQIQVKFVRAQSTFDEDEDNKDDAEIYTSDSNGSAKVALMATDRCIMAWQHIMQWLPDAQDEILPLLGLLQKIRTLGEHTFPNARAFVRVGLDE
jgi:hypothetical protein